MEIELQGFICPKCKSTRNKATLMRELENKKMWLATCMACGSQGMIEEELHKTNNSIII